MVKIGYLIQNQQMIQHLHACYTLNSEIQLIALKSEEERELIEKNIDLVIFDFYDQESERLDRFEQVRSHLGIRGICILESYSPIMIELILKHRIQYYCDSHISKEGLCLLVLRLMRDDHLLSSINERITQCMKETQIPQHLMGYDYIKTAILYVVEHEHQEFNMQDIYQMIARKYQTTQSRVERNMRKAISSSTMNEGIEKMSNLKFVMQCYQRCKEVKHG